MSLRLNVAANYASQLYATLIGILLIPLYLKWMGAEAYGLIAFFSMLQSWFIVLDLGLTLTIARESARYFGGALAPRDYRHLYRVLSLFFVMVALIGGGALVALAPIIAQRWLNLQQLPIQDIVVALQIMGACVAMRWMGGLYRGVATGAERFVWLGGFNALVATLRFAAVFASMALWGYTPKVFFLHQMAVAALELGILYAMARRLVPRPAASDPPIGWSFAPVAMRLRFSLTIAFTSAVWIFVTQIDKLILSGLLPLAEYGFFMVAVLVAGGITTATGPIGSALLPRLARLHAEGNHGEILRIYHRFAQLVSVVAGSLMVTLASCPESLLFAWTGDRELSRVAAPVLRLYAIGNGLLAMSAFPFYMQYARGNLRYHLIGNVGLIALLIPGIVFAALRFGGVGVGWVWMGMNVVYLFGWVAFVHGRLEPGLHVEWIQRNVLTIMVPTSLVGLVVAVLHHGEFLSRWTALVDFALVSTACIATACVASTEIRRHLPGTRFLRG
ncbi:polysaccharide biosynthesis protein [Ramlibacter sp. GTP1]|uniref:Polysaccharide biosynthesis protein n=1 Tax=Ramlibacter albus TaxID=2079448 RepID=A0A923MCJ8_9BURK|nr:polysaccharide biosynthesis protein [Ramlibacter albus]